MTRTPGTRALVPAILLVALCCVAPVALANQRIALVIGNGAYADAPLFNAVNDAVAIDGALSGLGFEVVRVTDAGLAEMQDALLEFSSRIEEDATALVFFAGHGIQADGRNYLVPVDARLESANRLRFEALELSDVLEELEYAPSKLNLVVLDACRNNPFLGTSRGAGGGLAAVDAATGTLIAYATAPGAVASDGRGANGLYTEHLLSALATPGLQAEAVFKQVRIGVSDASGGEQVPWESSSLTGDFVFNQSGPASVVVNTGPVVDPSAGAAAVAAANAEQESLFWDSVRAADDPDGLRAYLQRWPDGAFAVLARSRLASLADGAALAAATAEPANRCDDLAGPWDDYRDDRSCTSRLFLTDDGGGRYAGRGEVCDAPGLLGGLGGGRAESEGTFDGAVLEMTWKHGPCSGTARYEFDAQCERATGRAIGTRGGFGTCRGIDVQITLERAAR